METLKVTSNRSKRTFTIRKFIDGKLFAKYRTIRFSKYEFDSCEFDTNNDWLDFLRRTNDYYLIKR